MISKGVCVCVKLWFQGQHLYISSFPGCSARKTQHTERVFFLPFFLLILPDILNISESHFGKWDSCHTPVSLQCSCLQQKWLLSTPSNTATTAARYLCSPRGHDLNIKQTPCSVFGRPCRSTVTIIHNDTAARGSNALVAWCWYLVQRRFITYSFPPIYPSFHHSFCSERCYFHTFCGWLVACGAIVAAVVESYDITLWQEIITNIIHSAVLRVKWIQQHEGTLYLPRIGGEAKSQP